MDLKKVHEVVNRIQKTIFKNSSYIDSGFFVSSFKGAGLQFKEHQIYTYGDEIRFIDWKLLAKKNTPYIKTFEEERNIEVKVIIDCHSNFILSNNGKSKLSSILEMCAILIIFAGKTKDKVSIYFVGKKTILIKNISGDSGLLEMISTLNANGLVDDYGAPIYENYLEFVNEKFSRNKFKELYRQSKGPFVVFSKFNEENFRFLSKFLRGKNTHFFELRCEFEKIKRKFKFTVVGFKSSYPLKENGPEIKGQITYLDIDNNPLVEFVEGIMSYEKRV